MSFSLFITLLLNGFTFAGLLFVMTSGLTMIFGLMNIINMGHGALYVTAAYIGYLIFVATGSWTLGLAASAVGMAVVYFVLQIALFQRALNNSMLGIMISLGISWILTDIINISTQGVTNVIQPGGFFNNSFRVGNVTYPITRIVVLACAIAEFAVMYLVLKNTKIGMIVRAGVDDRDMVDSLGVNIKAVFLGVFTVSGFLVGIAGMMGGTMYGFNITAGDTLQMYAIMIIILGGSGNLMGTALGALILGLLYSFTTAFLPNYSALIIFGFVMVMMVFKPNGILGKEARSR